MTHSCWSGQGSEQPDLVDVLVSPREGWII